MKKELMEQFQIGVKVLAKIAGRPAGLKYKPFLSDGMQTDDIGGEYVEVSAIPDVWKEAIIIEALHPCKRKNGRQFKTVEWIGDDGRKMHKLLKNFKDNEIKRF